MSLPSLTSTETETPGSAAFSTTQWTRVLEARGQSPEAQAALSDLCAAYYAPVFAFIRSHSRNDDSARELTQEFFARLLSRQGVDTVDPNRGRFRSYLLGAVKHFLADMNDRANSLKRGGGQHIESIDASGTDTSPGLQLPDVRNPGPDQLFDRKWALTVLERALGALAEEHKVADKTQHFEALKPWLTGDSERLSQSDVASRIGMNEGAVKVAIHRLRRRFRELMKAEVSRTLKNPSQISDEIECLLAALGSN